MAKGKPIVCNETGQTYPSISAASKDTGISIENISLCIKSGDADPEGNTWQLCPTDDEYYTDTPIQPEVNPDEESKSETESIFNFHRSEMVASDYTISKILTHADMQGISCGVIDNFIMFFGITDLETTDKVEKLLRKFEYRGNYGITRYTREQYMEVNYDNTRQR